MNATQIADEIRKHATWLLSVADVLDPVGTIEELDREAEQHYAPYGYKADGSPYKRRPRRKKA